MSLQWDQMEKSIINFMSLKASSSTEKTAEFFTTAYILAVRQAQDPVGNKIFWQKGNPLGIRKAWMKAFEEVLRQPVDLGPSPWKKVSLEIVKYWTLMPLKYSIPHPGTQGPVPANPPILSGLPWWQVNFINSPGEAADITPGIYEAFKKGRMGEPIPEIAKAFVKTFREHTDSVTGVYNGIVPSPGTGVVIINWKGLK